MNDPITVKDIINDVIKLGDKPIICNYGSCSTCNYDPFCNAFFKCYRTAFKYKQEDKT